MIETSFTFLAVLIAIMGIIIYFEEKKIKLFNAIPGIILFYALIIFLSCFNLWDNQSPGVLVSINYLTKYSLGPLIFLMVMNCDVLAICRMGKKLLISYISAVISIILSFSIIYYIAMHFLPSNSWMVLGSLSGSWLGGAQNMVAIKNHLGLPSSQLANALITDTCNYSLWVCFLLLTVKWAPKYNKKVKAKMFIDEYEAKEKIKVPKNTTNTEFSGEFIFLLGISLIIFAIIMSIFSSYTLQIISTIIVGVIASFTPLKKMNGSKELANYMLFALIGGIAASSTVTSISSAPLYVLSGFMIITLQGCLLYMASKIFKLDLFSVGVASLANIGGIASAAILAKKHNEKLASIGAILAMLSIIFGYFYGLFLTHILFLIHTHLI